MPQKLGTHSCSARSNMWAHRVGELIEGFGPDSRPECGNMTGDGELLYWPSLQGLTSVKILGSTYLSSASSKGPVETGFKYRTLASFL